MKKSRIFLSPPWTDERERAAVSRAFDSGYVAPCGPMVDALEGKLAELSGLSAAAVSSGTAAMDLLMDELGVGPGWGVFASDLTFIASAGPAWRRGARLTFVDCAEDSGTIDPELLDAALKGSGRRRLVIATDLYGRCCDYDALEEVCGAHGAYLVIDAAEAVGARYVGRDGRLRAAGNAGVAAVYSFNGNKIVTTSGGGAVLSADRALVDRARKRSQQSRENKVWYEHLEVGHNYRMSNICAAIGCAQLAKLPEILARKESVEAAYAAQGFRMFPAARYTQSNHWLSVALLGSGKERDETMRRLAEADIESRPVWKPMHLQPVFRGCRYVTRKDAGTRFFRRGLCLPSGAGLTERDLDRIFGVLKGKERGR